MIGVEHGLQRAAPMKANCVGLPRLLVGYSSIGVTLGDGVTGGDVVVEGAGAPDVADPVGVGAMLTVGAPEAESVGAAGGALAAGGAVVGGNDLLEGTPDGDATGVDASTTTRATRVVAGQ